MKSKNELEEELIEEVFETLEYKFGSMEVIKEALKNNDGVEIEGQTFNARRKVELFIRGLERYTNYTSALLGEKECDRNERQ